jgi:S1-C subfamily serine protease
LQDVREDLLDWDNCTLKPNDSAYYAASEGLVCELINRAGPDAIARIVEAAFEEKRVDGDTLRRAVKKVTGLDLREFLRDYRMTWLGADFTDSARMLDAQSVVRTGNVVRVMKVYQGTPAEKRKLRPGDTILTVDGQEPISAAWLTHYVAAHRPRDRIAVEVLTAGKRVTYRMVTAARYVSP